MTEYPSNSLSPTKKVSDTPKKVEQVTTGQVIIKKATLGKRFKAAFTGEDGRSVATHVLWDVVIPAAKDLLYDAGQEALGRSLGIETRGGRRGGRIDYNSIGNNLASRVNYNRPGFMQDPRERQQPQQKTVPITTRGRVSIDDIILATRVEAEEVIAKMNHLIGMYGEVKIADLFDLVGVTGQYTDEKFGWITLDGARAHHTRDGYRLDLPNPIQLA